MCSCCPLHHNRKGSGSLGDLYEGCLHQDEEDRQTLEAAGKRRERHIRRCPTRGGITREPEGWASVPRARAMRMNAALLPERVLQEFEFEGLEMLAVLTMRDIRRK